MAEFVAREQAKREAREAYEAEQPADMYLDPVDPIRRAKAILGVPAPEAGDTPNGTAKSSGGKRRRSRPRVKPTEVVEPDGGVEGESQPEGEGGEGQE